jgi:hypothetical protein
MGNCTVAVWDRYLYFIDNFFVIVVVFVKILC